MTSTFLCLSAYYYLYTELLENIPSDIVQEMAKRKWEEIKRSKDKQVSNL